MKEIVLTLITLSLVTAHVTRDWSKTSRKTASTGLQRLASSEGLKIVGGNEASPGSLPYQVNGLMHIHLRAAAGPRVQMATVLNRRSLRNRGGTAAAIAVL
ncbi:uncharacterized protein LOC112906255 [Agrilus planipennis]|uniref:Uncharacterized protein LOC112906255 n=1 Tax=Agrilus planipennis TaxID=224129 RepID=A0A7F5RIS0_AGRPL|nr:uncharacterized protein LOC112906255 [Agrilus planipennis]